MFVGDRERDRTTAALREHYARGRLTLEEFSERAADALGARSHSELRRVLAQLPRGSSLGQALVRGAALVAFTAAYLVFSFAVLLVLAVTVLIRGASLPMLAAFLIVWLVPTYLLARLWHRPRRGRSVA